MKRSLTKAMVVLSFMIGLAAPVQAATYKIDTAHSTIGFAVKHMVVGTTRGQFNDYTGSVSYDAADLSTFSADVTIQVASIDTSNEKRDEHLKSADFFDAAAQPTITFKSSSLKKEGDGYLLTGNLTMKGVSKEIAIPLEVSGPVQNPYGKMVIGISGETTINRQDFNVSWSKSLDNGGLVVADNVKVIAEIEAASE